MADDSVNVEVGAKDTGLKDTMESSAAAVKQSSDSMMASIGAMVASVTGGMKKLDSSVTQGVNSVNEKLESVASRIQKIQNFMSLVGEVAMLGFIGDKVVDLAKDYAEWGDHIESTSKQTGMSAEKIQEWDFAARSTHVSSEEMNQGMERLSRTLLLAQQGSGLAAAALESVGIQQKDIKNINLDQALNAIADSFSKHADGAGKEALAMQLMRNAGVDLIPILDKGAAGIEELRQKAHEMGVILNDEDVAAAAALDQQMIVVSEQTHAMGLRLGAELAPTLMAVTSAMLNTTKQGGLMHEAVDVLGTGLKVLVSIALGAVAGCKQIGEAMVAVAVRALTTVQAVKELALAIGDFLSGNFDAARDHWANMQQDMNVGAIAIQQGWQKMNKTGQDYIETLKQIWGEQKKVNEEGGGAKGKALPPMPVHKPKHGGEDQAAKIAAARLALEKAMDQAEYAETKNHLDSAQKLYDDAYANGMVSLKEYYDATLAVTQANLKAQIDMKQKEVAEAQKAEAVAEAHRGAKGGEVAVLEARTRLVAVTGQLRVLEDQLATSADNNARKRADAERKLNEQLEQDAINTRKTIATAEVTDTKAIIDAKVAMNMMQKDQALALERDLVTQQYDIDKAALQQQLALYDNASFRDPVQIKKINDQLLALDRKYQSDLLANSISTQEEIMASYTTMIDGVRNAFQSGIEGMLNGTKSFAQGMRDIFTGILQAFDKMIAEKITKWIMGEVEQTYASVTGNATRTAAHVEGEAAQTAATVAGNTTRVGATVTSQSVMTTATVAGNTMRQASDWQAAGQSVMAMSWAAIKNIATKAWEAAASVYASIAAIPYVGPFLAPAMAVGAAALVLGFVGHIASAEGGYDIPPGVNPVTQLHEQEMVLPKAQANVIRNMASMAESQGASGQGDLHVHIHAMDATSFERRLMQSGGTLQAMLREAQRNGVAGELRGTWGAVG